MLTLKLACIEHTQNGDKNISKHQTTNNDILHSCTAASPGDTSNWVFNFDHKPKIFCKTYAIRLTSCLVKYTPVDKLRGVKRNFQLKIQIVHRVSVPRILSSLLNIFLYEKLCLKHEKIQTKFFRCGNLGFEIHNSSRKLNKRKLPDEQPLRTVVTYTCLLIHTKMQWNRNHRTKRSHIHNNPAQSANW
jgi:hypothetical protein